MSQRVIVLYSVENPWSQTQAEAWQRLGWALAQVKILSIFFD